MHTDMLHAQKKLAALVFVGMSAVIFSVLAFEYFDGFVPCTLCLQQREPYYMGIPVALLALSGAYLNWPQCVVRGALAIAGILAVYSLALAVYHSGVEWTFWAGPDECVVAVRFLGLSFAGWNVVVSAVLAYLAFSGAKLDVGMDAEKT